MGRPGTYAVSTKSLSPVEDALRQAGGLNETAALSRLLLVRPTLRKPILFDFNLPLLVHAAHHHATPGLDAQNIAVLQ